MKNQTVKSLKAKLKPVFSRYIRLRDCLRTTQSSEWGECISCGETKPFSQLDAGHFIPKHNANLFSEIGVNAQCRKCNRFQSGKQLEYRRAIVELYGEGADERLEEEARQIKKFTIGELEELLKYYTQRIKEME